MSDRCLLTCYAKVAIGMTPTAGSGVFGFLLRISGTFTAMCMSFVIWYVAGGRGSTAGVVCHPETRF